MIRDFKHGVLCDCTGWMLMKSPLLPGLKGRPSIHPSSNLFIHLSVLGRGSQGLMAELDGTSGVTALFPCPTPTSHKRELWPEWRSKVTNGSVVHKTTQEGSHHLSRWHLSSSAQTLPCGLTSGRAEPWKTKVGGEEPAHAGA